jgi:DNA invertase Pin-like site-specific DNA recombinase
MSQSPDHIEDHIARGRFGGEYLVYVRKSTDDLDNQKNSIQHQKAEALRLAKRERLPLAALTLSGFCTDGIISERHSAFKESVEMDFGDDGLVQYRIERPKFHRLVQHLSKRCFKGVVVLCWDRLSRNKADEVIVRKLMKAGVDVRFVMAQYDRGSAGELHMDIDGMFSEHHSRVTREKVTDTIRKKRAEGFCTHRANVGYLNRGTMEEKPFDPERAPIIARLFELADQTDWSLSDLRRWAIEQGLTMPPARRKRTRDERLADEERDERAHLEKTCRPPTVTNIHDILTSPFYTGKVRGNGGVWVKSASHKPLVSEERFARVQTKLTRRRTSIRYAKKLDLPFRGLIRCVCGRVYTPYLQKGIVYFGARCDRSCPNLPKSVSFNIVATQFGRVLDRLALSDDEQAEFAARAEREDVGREARQAAEREDKDRQHKKAREDLGYLSDNKLTLLRAGAYTAEAIALEEARLRALANSEPQDQDAAPIAQVAAAAIKLSELVKCGADIYAAVDPALKDRIARVVVSELTLSKNAAQLRCRPAFRWLESRFDQQCALSSQLSELATHHGELDAAVRELSEALAAGTTSGQDCGKGHRQRP